MTQFSPQKICSIHETKKINVKSTNYRNILSSPLQSFRIRDIFWLSSKNFVAHTDSKRENENVKFSFFRAGFIKYSYSQFTPLNDANKKALKIMWKHYTEKKWDIVIIIAIIILHTHHHFNYHHFHHYLRHSCYHFNVVGDSNMAYCEQLSAVNSGLFSIGFVDGNQGKLGNWSMKSLRRGWHLHVQIKMN